MTAYEHLISSALSIIVRDVPSAFWVDLAARCPLMYADAFTQVAADRSILKRQKIDCLLQLRHFQMEALLVDLATRHGLQHTMNRIVENNRHHAYVYSGDVGMTQSYVAAISMMPQPAKFRERLAAGAAIPRLDLGDEPPGAFLIPSIYGLIAHNPIGHRFEFEEQKLGTIQFCLPTFDCRKWAIEFMIPEILEAYPAIPARKLPMRSLRWKKPKGDAGTGTDGSR